MKKKKLLSFALVFAMMVTMILPAGLPAFAVSDPGSYIFDISEGNITVSAGTNADTLKVTYGASQVLDNIPIDTNITIIGTTTTNQVVVSSNVTANITLSGVDIEESADSVCPFVLAYGQFGLYTTVTLTLVGDNTLVSRNYTAGLQVGWRQNLTIKGPGTLNVTGGQYSAGIGDSSQLSSGIINIESGTTQNHLLLWLQVLHRKIFISPSHLRYRQMILIS